VLYASTIGVADLDSSYSDLNHCRPKLTKNCKIKFKIFGTVRYRYLEKNSIFFIFYSFFHSTKYSLSFSVRQLCAVCSEEDRSEVRREPAANPEMVGPGVQSAHRPAGVQSAGQYGQQGLGGGGRGDGGGRDGGHCS
jgi:hypothetical protein